MASALGINVGLVYMSAFAIGCFMAGLVGALIVSFVRTAGIQFFSEVELAVLYLIAAVVLPVKPTGLFGDA